MSQEIIDLLVTAQGECREVKRYVRHEDTLQSHINRFHSLTDKILCRVWHSKVPAGTMSQLMRLSENIMEGFYFRQVQPSVLEGYLEAAAFELGVIISRLRKAMSE